MNVIDWILDRMCSFGPCPHVGLNECRNCHAKVCNEHFDITCDELYDEPSDDGLCPDCARAWHESVAADEKARRMSA